MKKTSRFLAIFLALVLTFSVFPISAIATEATGNEGATVSDGAAAISTVEQFLGMTSGKDYYLTGDIDFSKDSDDWAGDNSAYTFDETTGALVVRNLVASFYGTLNGNNHTISGFKFTYTATSAKATEDVCLGVFGKLGNGSQETVISNLNIGTEENKILAAFDDSVTTDSYYVKDDNGTEDTSDDSTSNSLFGLGYVCGWAIEGRQIVIDNVHAYGSASGKLGTRLINCLGGLVGDSYRQSITVKDSSFDGAISAELDRDLVNSFVGGIVAHVRARVGLRSVILNCVNNADLSLTYTNESKGTADSSVGGIIGTTELSGFVSDCESTGAITTTVSKGDIIGYDKGTLLVVISDCTANDNGVYGKKSSSARLCVIDCMNGEAASSQNSEMTAISSVEDFSKLEGSTDFFYLTGDIDFENTVRRDYVVKSFSGVLYGNGYTLKNLKFNATGDIAFFKNVSVTAESAIIDLNMGTASAPAYVEVAANGKTLAVLAAKAGYNGTTKTGFNSLLSGIDMYADINYSSASGGNVGMFIGQAGGFDIIDSNAYGKITADFTMETDSEVERVGAFVATAERPGGDNQDQRPAAFIGCNNFAKVEVSSLSTLSQETGEKEHCAVSGFLARSQARGGMALDCNNFGDVTVSKESTNSRVGAFAGLYDYGQLFISNCTNYGELSGYYCGSAVGSTRGITNAVSAIYVNINGFEDYGRVNAAYSIPNNSYVCYTGTDLSSVVNVKTETGNIIGMKKGASIKIDPAVTGIRYRAEISEKALVKLEEIFGKGTVSYGTIIAPKVFIEAAGDEFTFNALDKFAESRKDLFANGTNPYVDVPATKWFMGENGEEKGVISGSIVNMSNLYKDEFVGRAYIKITVGDNVVYTLYADYFKNNVENNTRTVEGITTAAVEDLLYKNDAGYYTYNETDGYVPVTDADVIAKYSTNVGTKGEYTKYSCYGEAEYDALTELLGNING